MKRILSFALLSMLALAAGAQTPVSIPGSQVQKISSKIVAGQDYELHIQLPAGYGKSNKTYPTLYVMDSQWDFPLVTALYGQQYYDGFVPAMIIVGVTWTGTYSNPDSLRARDYTPTTVRQSPQSGGADRFLSVLRNELFPFVESRYRSDKDHRILMGCSLGGLFTVYTLFTQPDLFRDYVAATPAIAWDDEVIYKAETKYVENKNKPAARLYLCEGGVERGVPSYEKFVARLVARKYGNLQLQSQVLENTGHSGTKGIGYERGLQYVFERPSVRLTAAQAGTLSGTYKAANGMQVALNANGGQLQLDFGNNNRFALQAANEYELYTKAERMTLLFNREAGGAVTGFVLERYGSSIAFSKTK